MFAAPVDLRVSDAEREAVAEFLKGHYELGRLTAAELDERVDAAYRARVQSELRALIRDLPYLEAPPAVPARPRRRSRLARLAMAVALFACVVIVLDAVPAAMWVLFAAVTLPMLFMLTAMLAPFAIIAMALAWLARALRGPRPVRRVF